LSHPLFRAEAIAQHRDRLSGEVSIATPLAWQVIGWLMFGGLIAALTFLSLAGYARVETVSGVIVPNTGVAAIIPQRAGVIEAVRIREGQRVEAGARRPARHAPRHAPGEIVWEDGWPRLAR
jgi:membrane fusion protein